MFSIAVDVVKAIEEVDDLETLILGGNTCGVEACKAIGNALSAKPTFKVPLRAIHIYDTFNTSPV